MLMISRGSLGYVLETTLYGYILPARIVWIWSFFKIRFGPLLCVVINQLQKTNYTIKSSWKCWWNLFHWSRSCRDPNHSWLLPCIHGLLLHWFRSCCSTRAIITRYTVLLFILLLPIICCTRQFSTAQSLKNEIVYAHICGLQVPVNVCTQSAVCDVMFLCKQVTLGTWPFHTRVHF